MNRMDSSVFMQNHEISRIFQPPLIALAQIFMKLLPVHTWGGSARPRSGRSGPSPCRMSIARLLPLIFSSEAKRRKSVFSQNEYPQQPA